MRFSNITYRLWVFAVLALTIYACSPEKKESTETSRATSSEMSANKFSIELNDMKNSEGDHSVIDSILLCEETCWVEYQIKVPVSGRYRVEIMAAGLTDSSQIWIEDHVHNKDDRTYNITSYIELGKNSEIGSATRDGSPLRQGIHNIRLHLVNGVKVSEVHFSLLRKHQETPETLTQNMEGENWELVWSDEFERTGVPDTTKWTFDVGNWGWGNGELQYYTEKRAKNARQENGHLIIEAHKNDMGSPWTSARLTTRGKTSFVYGKIEFRAKVPAEKGNWAAGWTLGDSYVDELSWPYCGEIDILESVGYEMENETGNGVAHASAHCGAYYFKLGNQPTGTIKVSDMNESFHTYSVIWTPDSITALVDDETYFSYSDTSSELSWPFSDPQNIILNLAMGGGWGGLMGMNEEVDTQRMIVDYVRVYQKTN